MYFVPAFCISIMQKKLYAHICDQYVIVRKILIYPFGSSVPLNPNPPTTPPPVSASYRMITFSIIPVLPEATNTPNSAHT